MIIKGLVIFAFAIGIIDSIKCIPNGRAIDLAPKVRFIPVEARTALTFIHLLKRVAFRISYFAALNFTAIVGFRPHKIRNART